jgi:hypothetical protein
MSLRILTVGFALVASVAVAQDKKDPLAGAVITIQGCVAPATGKDQFVLKNVAELKADGTAITPTQLPIPVVYWLDDASGLKGHEGRMVQVKGAITKTRNSEVEVKAGPNGSGLIAEIEVPGKDVRASVDQVPQVVGTSGRGVDIKSVVIEMDVQGVTSMNRSCS